MNDIIESLKNCSLVWSRHALERILERDISRESVKHVLLNGEIIDSYKDDKPYPSYLVLGSFDNAVLHVVFALDEHEKNCYIITVYEPDENYFEADKKTRRKP